MPKVEQVFQGINIKYWPGISKNWPSISWRIGQDFLCIAGYFWRLSTVQVFLSICQVFIGIGQEFLDIGQVFLCIGQVFPSNGQVFLGIVQLFLNIGQVILRIGQELQEIIQVFLSIVQVFLSIGQEFLGISQVFLGIGQVFPSIGHVRTNARQEVGVQRRRVLSFLRFANKCPWTRYKWLVKREAVGDTVFSTFGKYFVLLTKNWEFIKIFQGVKKGSEGII